MTFRFATMLRAGCARPGSLRLAWNCSLPRLDFSSPRLFVDAALTPAITVRLDRNQAHYLGNVLRLAQGDDVLVFNGRDGEWRATLSGAKSSAALQIAGRSRPQPKAGDLHYCFAPLKHARLDYLVQKAVEMGASVLQPVLTGRTQAARVNLERMRSNTVEAAEQCGVLNLPEVRAPVRLAELLASWDPRRLLVFCDEDAEVANPVEALRLASASADGGTGVVVGPEGGFDEPERKALLALPRHVRLSLGPRILRADTAAVAALALVQATLGDWASASA